jgi:hypothetical protein
MRLGIIGFSQSGKTTLFRLLTGAATIVSRAASRGGNLEIGVVRVPDHRVDRLAALFRPRRVVHASLEAVDLAGFEAGTRAGLDLADLRSSDALLHVVRGFASPVLGAAPDPVREVRALEEELILADLAVVERRLERLGTALKRKATPAEQREQAALERIQGPLADGRPVRALELAIDESRIVRGFQLLSGRPILHCLNLAEGEVGERERRLAALAATVGASATPGTMVGWISAAVESEVAALPAAEQAAFLDALGLSEPALARVVRDAYALLGLASFFTVGEDEVRAWTIEAGATALEAAGVVHSDMARGFIRAEVVDWRDLIEAGSLAEARRRGILRLEGKDYAVKDGELCHFRFNVSR